MKYLLVGNLVRVVFSSGISVSLVIVTLKIVQKLKLNQRDDSAFMLLE